MKIKNGDTKFKDGEVYCETSCNYIQNSDSNDPESDGVQELLISEENAGGGRYYVIETKRWAVDELDDLIRIIEDYKKRTGQK